MSSQPSAPDLGTMYWMSGLSRLSVQPPVSHMAAAQSSPERKPLSSWSLLSKKNLKFPLHAISTSPTWFMSSDRGPALEAGTAEIRKVGHRRLLGVDHQPVGAPEIGQRVQLAVDGRVAFDDVEQRGLELLDLHLGQIDRLVDAEVSLHG